MAVVVAAIVAFGFNALWLGPLSGKRWAAEVGMDAASAGTPLPPILVASFAMRVVSAAALAAAVTTLRTSILGGVFVAVLLWVASGLAVKLNGLLVARRSATLFYIDSIGHLLTLVTVALIVSLPRGQ